MKKSNILRKKPDQGGDRLTCWRLENIIKGNWRWFKEMEI